MRLQSEFFIPPSDWRIEGHGGGRRGDRTAQHSPARGGLDSLRHLPPFFADRRLVQVENSVFEQLSCARLEQFWIEWRNKVFEMAKDEIGVLPTVVESTIKSNKQNKVTINTGPHCTA
jgi:hypothetical protein